ncbi:hypothetical protein B0T09DRAFT_114767 [Sordaria sp. MPI-SDFR-AT-0083]|nr:hypothetical protein B0T09DRAFT_114767 [Sordaria sp. MPI-SDFR-AT-0083]
MPLLTYLGPRRTNKQQFTIIHLRGEQRAARAKGSQGRPKCFFLLVSRVLPLTSQCSRPYTKKGGQGHTSFVRSGGFSQRLPNHNQCQKNTKKTPRLFYRHDVGKSSKRPRAKGQGFFLGGVWKIPLLPEQLGLFLSSGKSGSGAHTHTQLVVDQGMDHGSWMDVDGAGGQAGTACSAGGSDVDTDTDSDSRQKRLQYGMCIYGVCYRRLPVTSNRC